MSAALRKFPDVFEPICTSLVESGEASGQLDDVLSRIATQMEDDYDLRGKLKGAMTYPIFIVVVMLGAGVVVLTFVIPQLKSLFEWRKAENRKMHPLELAALVHLKLVSLQPFVDGNSRLSRLLMNWVLWKKNYPLIDIPANDLENYYNVLDKYQIEKDEKPFIQYIKQKYLGG